MVLFPTSRHALRLTGFSPVKINLVLAVTAPRADGFHDLVSVVCPLAFGDQIWMETVPGADTGLVSLEVSGPAAAEVPVDSGNLVWKATEAFRVATGASVGVRFHISKNIPAAAGLGGGSSNAATALRLLNRALGYPLDSPAIREVAATVGSDCALFMDGGPVVMRGRGEQIQAVRPSWLCPGSPGPRILLFKPEFGVETGWAYRRMRDRGTDYLLPGTAEASVKRLLGTAVLDDDLLLNNMEPAVFEKYLAIPTLFQQLREEFGIQARMSGSGSCCFCLLPPHGSSANVKATIQRAWGSALFFIETRLLTP